MAEIQNGSSPAGQTEVKHTGTAAGAEKSLIQQLIPLTYPAPAPGKLETHLLPLVEALGKTKDGDKFYNLLTAIQSLADHKTYWHIYAELARRGWVESIAQEAKEDLDCPGGDYWKTKLDLARFTTYEFADGSKLKVNDQDVIVSATPAAIERHEDEVKANRKIRKQRKAAK